MANPHSLRCGHSFELKNIERAIEEYGNCPLCRMKATKDDLFPNYTLKAMISKKMKKKKSNDDK